MHKIFKILEDKILNECGLMVMNLPAVQETRVQSLDREDPLEEDMATHSSILAWEISRTEDLAGYGPWVSQRVNPKGCIRSNLT